MESIISTFHIDLKIIIAQAVNFAVVFIVLYIFALKPLSKLMAERSEKISKGLDDAKTNAKLLQDTSAKYEEAITKAKAEANEIFQAGKKEAETKKAQMLEEAKVQVETMVKDGEKKLQAEKAKMVEEAKKELAALTISATEKILGGAVDKSYTDKIMKEVSNL